MSLQLLILFTLVVTNTKGQQTYTDWDCSISRDNVTGRYGDLSGTFNNGTIKITAIANQVSNANTSNCNGVTSDENIVISSSYTMYPLLKMFAIEHNQCQQRGCANITINIIGSQQSIDDICSATAAIGGISYDNQDQSKQYIIFLQIFCFCK